MDLNLNLQPKSPPSRAATTATFELDVLKASMDKPVIVDFWAPWCGPCRQLMPVLEKTVAASGGAVAMVTVDIDKNPELAQIFRVQSVPTIYAFYQGQPVDGFMGSKPESELKAFVQKLAGMSGGAKPEGAPDAETAKKLIAEADALFRDNNVGGAMEKYALALDADPKNAAPLGGIGWCLLSGGDLQSVRDMAADFTAEQKAEPRIRGLLFLLENADAAPETADLEKKIAANPKDHASRHALALQKLAVADLPGAIDTLVELTRLDRAWSDEKARKLLVALFEAMGPQHPLTAQGRRKLSAVLFS